jgi:TRAP-type transport system periplasmic protein
MKPMFRRSLLAALAMPAVGRAAQPITARIGVLNDEQSPMYTAWARFGQLVRRRTGGAVEVEVFPNAQLGGEKDVADGIRLGSVQGAAISLAVLSAWVPEGQIFELPFLFRDLDHAHHAAAGPVGEALKARFRPFGFVVLDYVNIGTRHPIGKFAIERPVDVRGKRIRVIQSPLHIALWRELGAIPTPLPVTEAYNALETGVVDFMDMSKTGYRQLRFYEVAPYFTELGHIYSLGGFLVGEQFWNRLTPGQQAVVRETAHEAAALHENLEDYWGDVALAAVVKSAGVKVTHPDPAPWREAMLPVWAEFAPRLGGMELVRQIQQTA